MQNHEKISGLKKKISGTLFRERSFLFGAGLAGTISGLVLIWIILSLIAGVLILPIWLKLSLLILSVASLLFLFWKLAFSRLFRGDLESTAVKLEKRFPELKGRLIAALEFSELGHPRPEYSRDLMEATLGQAYDKSADLNFSEVVSTYPLWKNLRTTTVSVVALLVLTFAFPGLFSYSYQVYDRQISPARHTAR